MPLRQDKSVRFCPYYRKTSRLSITAHQMHRILTIFPSFARGFTFYTENIRLSYKNPHRANAIRIEVHFEMKI